MGCMQRISAMLSSSDEGTVNSALALPSASWRTKYGTVVVVVLVVWEVVAVLA